MQGKKQATLDSGRKRVSIQHLADKQLQSTAAEGCSTINSTMRAAGGIQAQERGRLIQDPDSC